MNNHQKSWTRKDVQQLKHMVTNGESWVTICTALGRTKGACQFKAYELKAKRPKNKKTITYTKYLKPQSEVSLLWGLVKWTKA